MKAQAVRATIKINPIVKNKLKDIANEKCCTMTQLIKDMCEEQIIELGMDQD